VTERRSPRTDRPVRTAALLRRTLSDTAHLHGAAWWRLALVVFCTGLAMVVVVEVLLQLAGPVVRLLAPLVVTNGVLDPLGAVLLSLVAGVLFLVTCLPVVALGVATVVRLVDDRLAGGRLGVRAALRVVLPRLRAVTGLVLVSTVAVLVLAAVSPVLVVVGVLGLVLTPLVRLLGQRWVPAQRWPGVRVLGWLAVPFVLALRLLGSALLGVPAAVLDAPTVGAALRRADGTARGHRVLVVVLGGASLLVAVALQSATTFVGQLAGGQVGLVLGTVAGQLLFLALPAVVLTVLYRLAGAGDADGRLDPDLTVPYGATASAPTDRERATGLLVVATTYRRRLGAVLTASLVAGLLVPGVAQAQTETGGGAASTPSGSATLTVTSGADSVDPAVVATSASSCTSGAGECTLRGALAAASGLAAAGTVGAITVGFATDTTVAAVPGSRLTFSDGSGGSGGGEGAGTSGRLTLDGGGHRVVVDGAGLDLFSNGWNVTVRALEVTGAVGGAASGGIGGGFYVSGAGDSVLDGVTVDHSTATAGGGVYSYRGLRIVNSTFSDNVATAAPSDSTEGGGADVYSGGGSTTIESSSFAGSRGGAVFTVGFGSTAVTGSLFSPGAGGGFGCAGARTTGSGNVALGASQCTGTTSVTTALVGPLAFTARGAVPVLPLLVTGTANPARGAAASGCPSTDARGVARPAGRCDAGAFQLDPATAVALTSSRNPADVGDPVTVTAVVTSVEQVAVPGGSVQLLLDGVASGTPVPLGQGGVASFPLDGLPVGDTSVTATYTPATAGTLDPSTSPVLLQTVRGISSTVTLMSSANPSALGAPVQLVATVGNGGAAVTRNGTVTIVDTTGGGAGTTVAAGLAVAADGTARTTTSTLPGGERTLVARYTGDATTAAASSAPLVQRVQVPSGPTLALDPTTAAFGVPLRATVTVPTTVAGTTPTGTVTLSRVSAGSTGQSTATLDGSGHAVLALSDVPAGTATLTATYSGDGSYAAGTSPSATVTVTPATTATSLASSPTGPVGFGVPLTLTATVSTTSAGSTAVPAGTVSFTRDSTVLGTAALTVGPGSTATATLATTAGQLPVGSSTVSAMLTPTANFTAGPAATTTVVVAAAASSTTLTSDVNPAGYGRLVTLRAAVAPATGLAVATGSVTFRDGATDLGTASLVGGVATLGTASLPVGSHPLTAVYAGDGALLGSTSGPLDQVVTGLATATVLTTAPTGTTTYGAPLELQVAVTPAAGGTGTSPSGTVTVTDGATPVATILLSGGAGTATTSTLAPGAHTLLATFTPADGYLASSGSASVTVVSAATSTGLTASVAASTVGEPVTLTATVSTTSPGSIVAPAGTVTFSTPFATLGTVAVTASTLRNSYATLTVGLPESSAFPRGLPLTAVFTAAAGVDGSTGTLELPVAQGTTSLAVVAGPSSAGVLTTITATVTVLTGRGTPTGRVVFFTGGEGVGSAELSPDGTATVQVRLAQGLRSVQAVYTSGDRSFLAGDPASVSVPVGLGAPSVALSSTATGPYPYGTAATLTAVLGGAAPGIQIVGTVTFTASGAQGTTALGTATVQGDGSASLGTATVPVGTQLLQATYNGDGATFGSAVSPGLTQVVTAAGTTTTVTASTTPGHVGVPVVLTAQVTGTDTPARPTGTVSFTLAGASVGSARLDDGGSASVTTTPAAEVSGDLVATYVPDAGFTASTGSTGYQVQRRGVIVQLFPEGATTPVVGQSVSLRVRVVPDPVLSQDDPTGTVVLTAARGELCTVTLRGLPGDIGSDAACITSFAAAPSSSVTATYSGDALFAPGATTTDVAVRQQVPYLALDTPSTWVTGDPGALRWTVRGPTSSDGTITVRAGSTTVCTSTALVGSCAYTFPAGAQATTFELDYSGDAAWQPGRTSVDSTPPVECVRLVTGTQPTGAGAVRVIDTPTCNGGAGYVSGSHVRLEQTPNPGSTFTGWSEGVTSGPYQDVTVGPGQQSTVTARYTDTCIPVTLRLSSPVAGAAITRSTEPNCGSYPRQWQGTDNNGTVQGLFTQGTTLSLTPVAPTSTSATRFAPQSFYSWTGQGLPSGGALRSPLVLTLDVATTYDLTAGFGVRCYRGITFPRPDGGTAVLGAPNCDDGRGPGYAAGSVVPVSTRATGAQYFDRWTSGGISGAVSTPSGSTASFTPVADGDTVTARYASCVRLDVTAAGTSPVDGSALGSVTYSPTGNCPGKGVGFFTPGSRVVATASNPVRGGIVFGGWSGSVELGNSATNPTQIVVVTDDATLTATYYDPFYCRALTLTSVPAGLLGVRADILGGTGSCPPGTYDRTVQGTGDTQVALTATPTSGDPAVAWVGTYGRLKQDGTLAPASVPGAAGRTLTVGISGDSSFTAYACENLDRQVTLVSPSGTRTTRLTTPDEGFVTSTPDADCPGSISSFTVGQDVYLGAEADPAGYTFTGWSGAASGANPFPVAPVPMNGAAPGVGVTATYQVICHELASNFGSVTVDPAPNCPGAAPGSHSYVGGTVVTLTRTSEGANLFRGWTGAPDATQGDLAQVTLSGDRAVYANFTAKSVGESFVGAMTSVGDFVAVAAKKTVGVVAAVAGAVVTGANPLAAAAGAVALVLKGLVAGLEALGLHGAVLDGMSSASADIGAFLTYMTSTLSCATNWASSNGSTDAGAAAKTVQGQVGGKLGTQLSDAAKAAEAARDAARTAQTTAMRQAFQFTKTNSVPASTIPVATATTSLRAGLATAQKLAAKLGPAVAAGSAIYAMAGEGGWDGSAKDAWTSGGDQYTRCMALAVPDYLGLPPVPDSYPSP
jgi:hypothetical protein